MRERGGISETYFASEMENTDRAALRGSVGESSGWAQICSNKYQNLIG